MHFSTHHSFGGSFSAGSKPIFASKYAFFSILFESTTVSAIQMESLSQPQLAHRMIPPFSTGFCMIFSKMIWKTFKMIQRQMSPKNSSHFLTIFLVPKLLKRDCCLLLRDRFSWHKSVIQELAQSYATSGWQAKQGVNGKDRSRLKILLVVIYLVH